MSTEDLADRTGTTERYVREWCSAYAGSGYIGLFCGTEKFFRPGDKANLVQDWLRALEGVTEKLSGGGRHESAVGYSWGSRSETCFSSPSGEKAKIYAAWTSPTHTVPSFVTVIEEGSTTASGVANGEGVEQPDAAEQSSVKI